MREFVIDESMRRTVNDYLGYELIKPSEVGHHIFEEAPGQGKIGIECAEHRAVITTKFLDANGNIEWHKSANPKLHLSPRASHHELQEHGVDHYPQPFHCKLTMVSAKKAKVLIASLFPEEILDKEFVTQHRDEIRMLRSQMEVTQHGQAKMLMEEKHAEVAGHEMSSEEMMEYDKMFEGIRKMMP